MGGGVVAPAQKGDVHDQPGDQGGPRSMQLDIPCLREGQCPFCFLDHCIIAYPQSWLDNKQGQAV